jgi:hypothetical protein
MRFYIIIKLQTEMIQSQKLTGRAKPQKKRDTNIESQQHRIPLAKQKTQ